MTMRNERAEEIRNKYFPALNEGFVALKDWMGGDADIVDAARVSYGAGTKKVSDDRTLIRYLKRNRHTSPLEQVELKFHMKLPIFVARQLVRHRTAALNEYSGRYSLMPMLFYTPTEQDFALQSKTNKQGRGEQASHELYEATVNCWEDRRADAAEDYAHLVSEGVARELARIDLPLSTYTEWYWKIDLHNLMHFLGLRSDSHAQKEIRVFSDIMAGMAMRVAPHAMQAWFDYDFASMRLSRMEIIALQMHIGCIAKEGPATNGELWATLGMSKREQEEFGAKLTRLEMHIPSPDDGKFPFELDISKAVAPEVFFERAQAAVPDIDKVDQS
jgi:thymidylate synthase (FAD)